MGILLADGAPARLPRLHRIARTGAARPCRGVAVTSDATPGWAQARRLLEDALRRPDGPAELRVGHVRRVGSGRSHDVYCARVIVAPDDGRSGVYAVLLPSRDADRDARRYAGRERALLEHIAAATDRIRVPHITAVVPTRDGNAVVRPWLGGEPLDLREGRQPPQDAGEARQTLAFALAAGLSAAEKREVTLAELLGSGPSAG